MAASYPAALKTFSSVVNGVTKLVAALFNSPYDEITAIETMLGSMGSAQGYTDSFKNLLTHYRKGCQCVFNSTTALYVNPGQLTISDASGNFRFRKNTAQLTVDFTMIDTGAKANSTVYYIYATADTSATSFLGCLSLSATTPTGKTFYRLIGTCATDGSGNFVAGIVQSAYTFPVLGEWQSLAFTTVYQALTDGWVTACNGQGAKNTFLLTDGANPPTISRSSIKDTSNDYQSVCSFVRKADYFELTSTGLAGDTPFVYFIPFNQG